MLIFLLLSLILCVAGYTDEAINLIARSKSSSNTHRYCVELAKLPNNRTVDIQHFGWYTPYQLLSVNACDVSNLQNSSSQPLPSYTMIIIYENECKITEHAWNIEKTFGKNVSLMIITDRTNTGYELTYNETTMPVTIPVLVIWKNDFVKMNNAYDNLNNIELSIDFPLIMPKKFRPAILIMFLLVLIILLAGNFWAGDEFKKRVEEHQKKVNYELSDVNTTSSSDDRIRSENRTKKNSVSPNQAQEHNEPAVIPITCCVIIFIISFAVGWLLLLYYFPKVMIYIIQGKY